MNRRHCRHLGILVIACWMGVWGGCAVSRPAAGEGAEKPLFSFGAVADIQYADRDDAGKRLYRSVLKKIGPMAADLNSRDLLFTIELGDIINGQPQTNATLKDLDAVMGEFDKLGMRRYHAVGNHCRLAGADVLRSRYGLKSLYYAFTLPKAGGWHFVVLDGNDGGYARFSTEQVKWLNDVLQAAKKKGEKALVFSHVPLLKAAAAHHRSDQPGPVLEAMETSGCVAAYVAGHDHAGGYAFTNGIHHITLKGMVESGTGTAYSVFEVYPDRLKEIGVGSEPSRDLKRGGVSR